jgi:hypothetical protein
VFVGPLVNLTPLHEGVGLVDSITTLRVSRLHTSNGRMVGKLERIWKKVIVV